MERKRTKAQQRAYSELTNDLYWQERDLEVWKRQTRMIPYQWYGLHIQAPCVPRKKQLTLRLDEDMVKWYRGLGRGYQARMNQVLRTYMLARLSMVIEETTDLTPMGEPI